MTVTKTKEKLTIGGSFEYQGVIFTATSFPNKKSVYGINNDVRIKTPKSCTVNIDKILIL